VTSHDDRNDRRPDAVVIDHDGAAPELGELDPDLTEAVLEQEPKVDITKGNVLKNVLYMGIPSMIGFGAMTIYSLTDIYWVSRLGTAPVAAITLFAAIAWVFGSANQIIGTGSVALISRRFGEKRIEDTRDVIRQTLLLKFGIAMVMGALGLLIAPHVLKIMSDDPEVHRLAMSYGNIRFAFLPFMFTSYTIYTAFRGVGDAPKAMYIMLMSTALNVGLDPLFIFGFDMGIAGAAWATAVSAMAAVFVGIWLLGSGKGNITVPVWSRFQPRIRVMIEILKIGIPAGINGLLRSLAHWYVATLVATFGTIVVAAYGVSMRIMELGILFAVGLELGCGAIVGQNLGAKQKDRAHDAVVKATLLVLFLTGVLGAIEVVLAPQILGVFADDPSVLAAGIPLIRLMAIAQIMIAMHIVLSSAFYGSGNTWPPTVIAAIIEWGVQIPLILGAIHVLHTSELGVWWSMFIAASVEVILTYVWFRRGKWKDRKV